MKLTTPGPPRISSSCIWRFPVAPAPPTVRTVPGTPVYVLPVPHTELHVCFACTYGSHHSSTLGVLIMD